MFEHYTEGARHALFAARMESTEAGADAIESEHLLLGLIRAGQGIASSIFGQSQVTDDEIRRVVRACTPQRSPASPAVEMPFSTDVRRILKTASSEAKRLHHRYVGSEHLLLGILHEPRILAARLLEARGVSADSVVAEIARAQEARRQYEELVGAIKAAVDAADPRGLLRIGAPDDEYEPEVSASLRE